LNETPIYDRLKMEFLTADQSANQSAGQHRELEPNETAAADEAALGDSDAEYDKIKDRELGHE
jgi:hypothetical protein